MFNKGRSGPEFTAATEAYWAYLSSIRKLLPASAITLTDIEVEDVRIVRVSWTGERRLELHVELQGWPEGQNWVFSNVQSTDIDWSAIGKYLVIEELAYLSSELFELMVLHETGEFRIVAGAFEIQPGSSR